MSPPVIGSLLGLAIAMIFPQSQDDNVNAALSDSWAILSSPTTDEDTGSERSASDHEDSQMPGFDKTPEGHDTFDPARTWVRLSRKDVMDMHNGDSHWGLFGCLLQNPDAPEGSCSRCHGPFQVSDGPTVIYQWRCKDGTFALMHFDCVHDQIFEDKMESHSLKRVRALLSKTDHQELISSLFDLQGELADFDPDPAPVFDFPSDSDWADFGSAPPSPRELESAAPVWIRFKIEGSKPVRTDQMKLVHEMMMENGVPFEYIDPPCDSPLDGNAASPEVMRGSPPSKLRRLGIPSGSE